MDCLTWAIIQPYISNALIIRVEDHFRELARSARTLTGQDALPWHGPPASASPLCYSIEGVVRRCPNLLAIYCAYLASMIYK